MMQTGDRDLNKVYLAMVLNGICVTGAGLAMPLLRDYYSLSYDMGGLLLSLMSVGNLLATFSLGIAARRVGIRLAALALAAGHLLGYSLLALSAGSSWFLIGFFLIGIGKGATTNHCTVLSGNRSTDRTGTVNLINALFALGALIVPFIFMLSGATAVVKAPLVLMALSGLMIWLLFCLVRDHGEHAGAGGGSDFAYLREKRFWFSALFLFFEQCTEISVSNWLVTYFKDAGILSGALSELSVTVFWVAMLLSRLFIAFVLRPGSRCRSLILVSLATFVSYFLLLGARGSVSALMLLFIFGVSVAGAFPTAVAEAGRSLSSTSTGTLLAIGSLGAILMPYVVGAVAERTSIQGGMYSILAAAFLMIVSAFLIKLSSR